MVPAMLKRSILLAGLLTLFLAGSSGPASAKLLYLGDKGVATVGKVACPGTDACELVAPKRVRATIGPSSFWAQVLVPKRIAAGKKATVRVKLGGGALGDLAGRTTTVAVKAVVRQGTRKARTEVLKVRLRRAALALQPAAAGTPASGPLGTEPPLLARPAGAVDVSALQLTWYPRDSWIDYLVSTTFSNGATGINSLQSPCTDKPDPNPESGGKPYTVQLQAKPSWFDRASGVAGIYGQGSVHFRYPEHGIDLIASDPEVEINGAASRLILRLEGSGNSGIQSQRVVFATLNLAGQPTKVEGDTYTYDKVRANLVADSASAFSTFYPPGTPWGCVSVSFTAS